MRLNPYFNGTCSKRQMTIRFCRFVLNSLNPYFNGTCSKSFYVKLTKTFILVLILVLVEHAQRCLFDLPSRYLHQS